MRATYNYAGHRRTSHHQSVLSPVKDQASATGQDWKARGAEAKATAGQAASSAAGAAKDAGRAVGRGAKAVADEAKEDSKGELEQAADAAVFAVPRIIARALLYICM